MRKAIAILTPTPTLVAVVGIPLLLLSLLSCESSSPEPTASSRQSSGLRGGYDALTTTSIPAVPRTCTPESPSRARLDTDSILKLIRQMRTTRSVVIPPTPRSGTNPSWTGNPRVAENGSYYGQVSALTGRPKTVHVRGYYRRDGTYVRGHYRSRPRR